MRLELLATLREKLLTAKELIDVVNYFMDHFGEDPEFHEQGKKIGDPVLESVLKSTAAEMLGAEVQLSRLLMISLRKYRFVHGPLMANGHVGSFIFFDDVQTGLMTITPGMTGETRMARFSMRRLPPAGHD